MWWKRSKGPFKRPPRTAARDGWVRIAIAPNQVVAGMIEGALESEDIPFLDKKLGLDFPTSPSNMHEVLVPQEHRQRARDLLQGMFDLGEEE